MAQAAQASKHAAEGEPLARVAVGTRPSPFLLVRNTIYEEGPKWETHRCSSCSRVSEPSVCEHIPIHICHIHVTSCICGVTRYAQLCSGGQDCTVCTTYIRSIAVPRKPRGKPPACAASPSLSLSLCPPWLCSCCSRGRSAWPDQNAIHARAWSTWLTFRYDLTTYVRMYAHGSFWPLARAYNFPKFS